MEILKSQESKINKLEAALGRRIQKLQTLKEDMEKDLQARDAKEKKMLKDDRAAKFFREKLEQTDVMGARRRLDNLNIQTIVSKQKRVRELEKALEEFQALGPEPTNETLKRKIDDLKKSRLSLDMSFND